MAAAALCSAAIGGCREREAQAPRRPNVLLVVLDTLRADMLDEGPQGPAAPGLGRLASESVVFTSAYTVGAATPPALTAIMTGRQPYYPRRAPWTSSTWYGLSRLYEAQDATGIPSRVPTLAEHLQRAGYDTAALVTNPYLKARYGFGRGFAEFQELLRPKGAREPYVTADVVTDRAVAWLEKRREERTDAAFFLYVHLMDAHSPYVVPESWRSSCSLARVPGKTDAEVAQTWFRGEVVRTRKLAAYREHAWGLYTCAVRHADHQLERLFASLKAAGEWERTLVVALADHGEEFAETGATGHQGQLSEPVIHVPLVVRVPALRPRRVHRLVRNFDVMPTILDYAGVAANVRGPIEAVSLRPFLEGGRGPDLFALVSFPRMPRTAYRHAARHAVRMGPYKLVRHGTGEHELYDLRTDAAEARNLAAERPETVQRIGQALDAAQARLEARQGRRARAATEGGLDADTAEQLKALGYIQ